MIEQKIEPAVSSLETLVQTYFHRAIINSRNAVLNLRLFNKSKKGVVGYSSTVGGVQISLDPPFIFPHKS
jgi:hypothetical protein